jgi:anthranilate synthase/aminodeoxychorismate synthase-like glutamine amidotransferase
MLIVIDNYDSFTYNLVQYFGELGAKPVVYRNDAIDAATVLAMRPDHVVISPGPGTPDEAGVSLGIIRACAGQVPLLGVCLGHQAIGQVFGGRIIRAPRPIHGKTSIVNHDGTGLFEGLRGPVTAGRYHSLVVSEEGWPASLAVTAHAADDGTVMALRHRQWPVFGLQFHPESVLTPDGRHMLRNFLARTGRECRGESGLA